MEQDESGEDLPESGEDGQKAEGFFDLSIFSKILRFFGTPRLAFEFEDITDYRTVRT